MRGDVNSKNSKPPAAAPKTRKQTSNSHLTQLRQEISPEVGLDISGEIDIEGFLLEDVLPQNESKNTEEIADEPKQLTMEIEAPHAVSNAERSESLIEKPNEVKLADFLLEIDNFEDALHILNEEGEKMGLKFKKGNIQYYEDKTPKYKSIICSCKSRHKATEEKSSHSHARESFGESKLPNQKENASNCPVFYRFRFKEDTIELVSKNEVHSDHQFKIPKNQMTDEMISDLSFFNKNTSVAKGVRVAQWDGVNLRALGPGFDSPCGLIF